MAHAARRLSAPDTSCACNICGWHGGSFLSGFHSEGALCPSCGSIARDRFLYWCWTHRTGYDAASRVLEQARLDERYRSVMAKLVDYTASDFDESAHRAMIKLDLQHIALPDNSVDVLLNPHVLKEHVPDTGRSLAEIYPGAGPGWAPVPDDPDAAGENGATDRAGISR